MKKLSKNSIYAIKYLFSQGMSADKISEETGLSINNVSIIIEEEIKSKTETKQTAKDLMINETAVKRTNSVSIMTKEASMINDHDRTKNKHKQDSSQHIFNPFKK
jgi:DNA-binding transcriptional regulator GbsR (MarR family)